MLKKSAAINDFKTLNLLCIVYYNVYPWFDPPWLLLALDVCGLFVSMQLINLIRLFLCYTLNSSRV